MQDGEDVVVLAARRLLAETLDFTENERAERNVEAALGLLDAREASSQHEGIRTERGESD
ncbi:hypothetical protein [Halosegnis sp.]|uniref:hypothetical protein n=1 Tax=Halosegnis sp. TaxID=2864959 RepID=UPI0035D422C5